MKAFLTAVGTTTLMLISVNAWADDVCANGRGILKTAPNGQRYCMSKMPMNWWSAFAWCDSVGGILVHPSEDCDCSGEACDLTVDCPNLKGLNSFWTRSKRKSSPYTVEVDGRIHKGWSATYSDSIYALCRLSKK